MGGRQETNKYKQRHMQKNDNELNILAKLKKETRLTKMLHSNVKFVLCAFLRSQIKNIFKFTSEIAQEK